MTTSITIRNDEPDRVTVADMVPARQPGEPSEAVELHHLAPGESVERYVHDGQYLVVFENRQDAG